ncbi:MAG TPA: hypothetical protein VJ847_05020 [Gemmatimonadales bacterium]|jgi:hypothetical protein|nr:hypothetical protein [Gemmatimonadales bacterium]
MRTLVAGLMLLQAGPLVAQSSGTLVVRRNGAEIGREQVTLEQGRRRGMSGTTLTVASRYPATAAASQLGARLERTPDGQLAVFQLDVEKPDPVTFLAAGAGARIVLKTIAKGSDAAQEMPGGPDVVLLDDNAVALFTAVADLATPAGVRLTGFYPRTGRRASFTARKDGTRVTLSGGIAGSLTVDESGRLTRAELPGGVTASLSE